MSKTLPKFSLNSFISPAQTEDWYKNVGYQDAKNIIKEKQYMVMIFIVHLFLCLIQ